MPSSSSSLVEPSTSVNTRVTVPDGCTSLIERDCPPIDGETATLLLCSSVPEAPASSPEVVVRLAPDRPPAARPGLDEVDDSEQEDRPVADLDAVSFGDGASIAFSGNTGRFTVSLVASNAIREKTPMYKRRLLAALSVVAVAAVVATTATAAYGPKASRKAVEVEVFSPRKDDVAGRQSKGFLVDLALRYPSLAASGADFQLTGPTTHQNQAPFPGTFAPGVDEKVPGLIVLLSTTTVGAKNAQNLANLFNLTGFTNQRTNEIWDTWIVGAPSSVRTSARFSSRRRGRQEQGRDLQRRTSGRSRLKPRRPHQRGRPRGVRDRLEHRRRAVRDPRLNSTDTYRPEPAADPR